jgi:hypothetical protein
MMSSLAVRIFETSGVSVAAIEAQAASGVFASSSSAQAHIVAATGVNVTVNSVTLGLPLPPPPPGPQDSTLDHLEDGDVVGIALGCLFGITVVLCAMSYCGHRAHRDADGPPSEHMNFLRRRAPKSLDHIGDQAGVYLTQELRRSKISPRVAASDPSRRR